jgi:AraC-like DNA-binding protein
MSHVMRSAAPPLDRFIGMFWYWEGDAPVHARDTIMASAASGILVNLAEDRLNWYEGDTPFVMRGIGISGPHSRHFTIDAFHPKVMGVHFHPGGTFPFFGATAAEFGDRHVALEDVWGASARRLQQQLVEAPTPDAKFDILEHALREKWEKGLEPDPWVAHAMSRISRAPHRTRIGDVAKETDLSRKRFIRIFNEQVGFTPKLFLRLERFQRVLSQLSRQADADWGDIVERNGFYDQSHFIHDFGAFSGLSPSVYLKRRGPYLQHVPEPA